MNDGREGLKEIAREFWLCRVFPDPEGSHIELEVDAPSWTADSQRVVTVALVRVEPEPGGARVYDMRELEVGGGRSGTLDVEIDDPAHFAGYEGAPEKSPETGRLEIPMILAVVGLERKTREEIEQVANDRACSRGSGRVPPGLRMIIVRGALFVLHLKPRLPFHMMVDVRVAGVFATPKGPGLPGFVTVVAARPKYQKPVVEGVVGVSVMRGEKATIARPDWREVASGQWMCFLSAHEVAAAEGALVTTEWSVDGVASVDRRQVTSLEPGGRLGEPVTSPSLEEFQFSWSGSELTALPSAG